MKCVRGNIQNTDLQHDSNKVKGRSKRRRPFSACLNRDILWHNEGIWRNIYHCFIDTILDLARCDSWVWHAYRPPCTRISPYTAPGMHHIVKLRYGVDNPCEVGSTAVYLPSWIHVNSVCKVANATLQFSKIKKGTELNRCKSYRDKCVWPMNLLQCLCVSCWMLSCTYIQSVETSCYWYSWLLYATL